MQLTSGETAAQSACLPLVCWRSCFFFFEKTSRLFVGQEGLHFFFEVCHHRSSLNSSVSQQRIFYCACIDGSACEIDRACRVRFGLVCICVPGRLFVGEHSIDSDFVCHVSVWRGRPKLTQFGRLGAHHACMILSSFRDWTSNWAHARCEIRCVCFVG